MDHSVFTRWHPRCVKGRTEVCGHKSDKESKRETPAIELDYVHIRREPEKEKEKVMKDEKSKMITATVVRSRGVDVHAVESVRKALE